MFLFCVLSQNVFVYLMEVTFLVRDMDICHTGHMYSHPRFRHTLIKHNSPHQMPSVLEPAVNLWKSLADLIWLMVARKRTIHFEVTSIQSKLGLKWSFQIGGFSSAKQVEVGLPVCSDILRFRRRVSFSARVLVAFLLGQTSVIFFTGATSQLTAPRANRLMLMATPPSLTWPTLSLETW